MYKLGKTKVVLENYDYNLKTTIEGEVVGIDSSPVNLESETTVFLTITTKLPVKIEDIIKVDKNVK